MSVPVTVAHAITMTALTPTGNTGELATTWSYSTRDPYAVTITLTTNDDRQAVAWVVARGLLHSAFIYQGNGEQNGEGDLKCWIWSHRYWLAFHDSNGDRDLLCSTDLGLVRGFLADTIRVIPPGSERVDIDTLIERLLGEGAAS